MNRFISASAFIAVGSMGFAACLAPDAPGGEESEQAVTEENAGDDSAALASGQADERYIVVFHDYSKRASVLQAAGGQLALELPSHHAVAAYLPAAAAEGLAHHPDVAMIELDPRRYPTAQTVPYGITMVQGPNFTPPSTSSAGAVKVCIIDSGLHTGHPDLQGLPVTGQSGTSWNQDGCGHGTHVAGTIAAVNNDIGVVGVAPGSVSLHIVRVFGDSCSWTYASGLVAALGECQNAGAKVVSMSLGGRFKSQTESTAFANAEGAGILSIAAAGNAGNKTISYPAGYASVMSVAAVDQNKARASFSQRNADVEIAAPGVGVLSTVPKSPYYEAWSGTSMATPHVSGVAALVWSVHPALTNVQIREALDATAEDLGAPGRDSSFGHGLVQASAALAYLQ